MSFPIAKSFPPIANVDELKGTLVKGTIDQGAPSRPKFDPPTIPGFSGTGPHHTPRCPAGPHDPAHTRFHPAPAAAVQALLTRHSEESRAACIPGPLMQRQDLETGIRRLAQGTHGPPGPSRNRLGSSTRPARLGITQGPARPWLMAHLNRLHSRPSLTQGRLILRIIGL